MRTIDRLWLRLRSLFHRDRVEGELDEELRFHIEALTRQKIERGMPPGLARSEALQQFGGVAQVQEECRDKLRTRWIEDFAADFRYALRLFAKSPGFAAVATLSLALGIGANTAIFTLVETVLLRELPVREPGALVQIVGAKPGVESTQGSFSYPSFQWLRARTPMFSHMFTWSERKLEAGQGEGMEWVSVDCVSEDYFAGLGSRQFWAAPWPTSANNPWWRYSATTGGAKASVGTPRFLDDQSGSEAAHSRSWE